MTLARPERPGAASLALLMILIITAAWWALALWPAGDIEPLWLLRTRSACFGSAPGGLPETGGWILLIGEPIGMLGVLFAVWGKTLRLELRRMALDRQWRLVMLTVSALGVVFVGVLGRRVAWAAGMGRSEPFAVRTVPVPFDVDVSSIVLTDQWGGRTSLAQFEGRPVLLTFAFGHCVTVCPTVVHDVITARTAAGRLDVPVLIITLDPWRDTPERLPTIATEWGLGADDRVLSGSIAEVERALDLLRVARSRDSSTGDIAHAATVMATDGLERGRGRVAWRLDGAGVQVRQLLARMPVSGRM